MQRYKRTLLYFCSVFCIIFFSTYKVNATPRFHCKLSLNKVTDAGYWTRDTLPALDRQEEKLPRRTLLSIAGSSTNRLVVIGRIYSYLASIDFDPAKDSDFKNIQEKIAAHARYLFYQVESPAWVVLETKLSNEDHIFLGYSGHFLRIKPNGKLSKGNLKKEYMMVSEEDLMNAPGEEVFADLIF